MTTNLPFVSVCTPTFNRRPFIKNAIKCFKNQDYPKELMEWVIIDDGSDKIQDILDEADLPQIKYYSYDEKMTLGKKRNLMHSKAKGDILVYFDDDDYYPSNRVSHAVEMLQKNPDKNIAGSSIIHLYFTDSKKMVQFGPYGNNHATAATFAFRRELLNETSYDETKALAEEEEFLKKQSIPMVQLDSKKTILVFTHSQNSFDKRKLIDKPNPHWKYSDYKVDDFIKEEDIKNFFCVELEDYLKDYDLGNLKHKPDVIEGQKIIEEKRKKLQEEAIANGHITMQLNGDTFVLKPDDQIKVLNDLLKANEIMKFKLFQAENYFPPVKIPVPNKGFLQVPTKYAEVFIETILRRSAIYESKLEKHNLLSDIKDIPLLPPVEEVCPDYIHFVKEIKKFENQQPNLEKPDFSNLDNNSEDIQTIIDQTECSKEMAEKVYQENNNDIVETIMKIFELKESGDYEKMEKDLQDLKASSVSESDVELIVLQTECSKERAQQALVSKNQDIVEAILEITNEQDNNSTKDVKEKEEKKEEKVEEKVEVIAA